MKIDYIKRGAATRLILIFAGWSTDTRYYSDCVFDGWDTAVVSDYREMSMPDIPGQYSTIYIFAYSLGVKAASLSKLKATVNIAICGTPFPSSDDFGIPETLYRATADGLTERSLTKFHLRMAGDKANFERIKDNLPASHDIIALKDELYTIAAIEGVESSVRRWDKAYLASDDRIFPFENQKRFWDGCDETIKVVLESSHAPSIYSIIKDSLPDPCKIGEGFAGAVHTYNENAVVQAEICEKIGEKLTKVLEGRHSSVNSLLEIGVGQGLLTDVWRKIVAPEKAVYIDLSAMPRFDIAAHEEYVEADAEEWLKTSDASFDIILSASTIQWFADPVGFIETVKSHLNPCGVAIISTFVKENLHQLDAVRPCPIIYRTAEDYKLPIVSEMQCWESTMKFQSWKDMLMHLKLTGVAQHSKREKGAGSRQSRLEITRLPVELTFRPLILVVKA